MNKTLQAIDLKSIHNDDKVNKRADEADMGTGLSRSKFETTN